MNCSPGVHNFLNQIELAPDQPAYTGEGAFIRGKPYPMFSIPNFLNSAMKLSYSLSLFLLFSISALFPQGVWERLPSPVAANLYRVQFVDSLTGWAAGDSGVIIKTTDGGLNWIRQESGISSAIYDLFFLDENRGWGVTWRSTAPPFGTNIIFTNSGGEEWFELEYPEENVFLHTIRFTDSVNGYIGGEGGVLKRTTDGGFTWRECEVQEEYSGFPILNLNLNDGQYAYANGGHVDVLGIIWRTTNGGEYWSTTAVSPEPIYTLQIIDSLNAIGMGGDWEYGTMVVATTNRGESWGYLNLDIYGIAHEMQFRTRHDLWVALGAGQVLLNTNDPVTPFDDTLRIWNSIPTPGGASIYDIVFTDSLTGFGVGDSGAIIKYRYTKPNDISEYHPLIKPAQYVTVSNYPNPFNPSTTVQFDTEEQGWLEIRIYNTSGELISELYKGVSQPGRGRYVFDASRYPSGIYFYRAEFTPLLRPGERSVTGGKMTFVR